MIPSENDINESVKRLNRIDAGISATAASIVLKARFHNTPIISWENGKIVEIDPFTIELPEDKNKPKS